MCIYSVVLIFDLFFGLQRVTGCLTFASNIVAVRNVVAQQRPFEQTTDAFNPIGRQTESESSNYIYSYCPDSGGKRLMWHGIPFYPTTVGGESSNYIRNSLFSSVYVFRSCWMSLFLCVRASRLVPNVVADDISVCHKVNFCNFSY